MPDPMPLRPEVAPASAPAAPTVFKVELDERCVTFPDGKLMQHLLVGLGPRGTVVIEAVYAFNRTRQDPALVSLSLAEARDFSRELIGAVYTARAAFVLNDTLKLSIAVVANGYVIEFTRADERREVFLSTGVIWRVIKALLMAVDAASPVVAN